MVSHNPPTQEETRDDTRDAEPRSRVGPRVEGVIASLTELLHVQTKIIMLKLRVTIERILIAVMLGLGAVAVGILAIIFLDIGVYRLLTDILGIQPAWTWLIFAAVHAAGALVLIAWARKLLRKKLPEPPRRPDDPARA